MPDLTNNSWNNFYRKEIENFAHNEEDTGECWFDDSGAEAKMVQFLLEKLNDDEITFDHDEISVLDLGTGNGHLLFELHDELEEEYDGTASFAFTGVDYSPDSVGFASEIAHKKYPDTPFKFSQVDLLLKDNPFLKENKFDILLDKGTLDAIALNQDPVYDGKIGMEIYADQVQHLMDKDSILLITSCNFTEVELEKIITKTGALGVWDKIKYPSFQFGGVQGSTICSIAFKKL